jgi:hypothetical protein
MRRSAQWLFVLFALLFVLFSTEGRAQQESFDREAYYRAVKYCRQNASFNLVTAKFSRMTLSPDKRIVCFDGEIVRNMQVSLMNDLEEGGLFVVRSGGGHSRTAIMLADIIRDRHATVVVYDFCVSACAEYFLIASDQTYLLKGTLVAWHNPVSGDPSSPLCSFLETPRDGGPQRLRRGPCNKDAAFGDRAAYSTHFPAETEFYKGRVIDPLFDAPPDSRYVRRIVTGFYKERGVYRDIGWTIHPRYYPRWFKTNIFYEAYPESQEEVDGMLARLGVGWKVIYDP